MLLLFGVATARITCDLLLLIFTETILHYSSFRLIYPPSGAYSGKTPNMHFQFPKPSIFPAYRGFESRQERLSRGCYELLT